MADWPTTPGLWLRVGAITDAALLRIGGLNAIGAAAPSIRRRKLRCRGRGPAGYVQHSRWDVVVHVVSGSVGEVSRGLFGQKDTTTCVAGNRGAGINSRCRIAP